MAQYTYNEFEDFARRAGLYDQFSPYDLELAQANPDLGVALVNAKNDWNTATSDAARSAANQRAEAIRSNAYNTAGITSYTGGSWGAEYNPITNGSAYNPTFNGNPTGSMLPQSSAGTGSSFTPQTAQVNSQWSASNMSAYQPATITPSTPAPDFGTAPQYNSPYTSQIEGTLGNLNAYPEYTYQPFTSRYDDRIQTALDEAYNRDPFSYDYATDPVYQAYAKQYRREGERSMQNTLAQQAARTGGVASTAGVAAAQQANNYYNAQLADRIPQLYADAYNRYLSDYEMSRNKLTDLMALDNTDYDRYDTDRKFGFNVYQDRYNQMYDYYKALLNQDENAFRQAEAVRDQFNTDANRSLDVWSETNRNQQWADEMARQAANDAWNAQMDLYGFGYDQEADAYNRMRDEEEAAWERAYKERLMELQYGGGSGGGSRSGGGGSSSSGSGNGGIIDGGGVIDPYAGLTNEEKAAIMAYNSSLWAPYSGTNNPESDTIPVYADSTSNNIYDNFSQADLAQLIDQGVVRGMYTSDGRFRYIYVGDIRDGLSRLNAAAAHARARNLTD